MRAISHLSLLVLVASTACTAASPAATPAEPVAAVARPAPAPAQHFLRDFAETGRFRRGRPTAIRGTPKGDAVLFLRADGPRSFRRDLWTHDPATGEERLLVSAEKLLGGEETISADEQARRERMRLVARGIAAYSLSADGARILVPLSGRLFVVERATGAIRELATAAGEAIDPRFSPDGAKVAFVRDGDLHVVDVASGRLRRLTRHVSPTVTFGLAEFVAQEEMGRMEGYWWSPDGAALAVQEVDTAGVELLHIPDPFRPQLPPQAWPYPRAGTANAATRLAVIPAGGGRPVQVRWDSARYPYLAAVAWPKAAPLTLLVQTRAQDEEVLLAVDPKTGATTPLLVERDEAWVNLHDGMPRWLPDGSGFLWISERDGMPRLELRGRDGAPVRPLTPEALGCLSFLDLEGPDAYALGCEDPAESHLVRIPLDGSGPVRVSREAGDRRVAAVGGGLVVDQVDLAAGGHRDLLLALDGTPRGELRSTAEAAPFTPDLEVVTVDSPHRLKAAVIRPRNFDPSLRYPVLLSVYAGPGVRTVSVARDRYLLSQWQADHGLIVVSIDGRGTPGRGRAFERAIRGELLDVPLADQVEGLEALGARFPELDLSRVGVYGWSFGGTFSATAALKRPDVFHAAVAVAPVTDWRDYDTHYTERYLGMPAEAAAAYERASPLFAADRLERPLLLVHGTADDNVSFSHSLKLSDALFRAGRPHELLPIGGQAHGVSEPAASARLQERIAAFQVRHLGAPVSGASGPSPRPSATRP